jgi:Predicted aminopeptidases
MAEVYVPGPTRFLENPIRFDFTLGLATFIFIIALVALGLYRLSAPDVVPANAPPLEFSSGRAMKTLDIVAKEAHPIGSLAHSATRDYLVKQLTDAGLAPQVQTSTGVSQSAGGTVRAGTVNNILARLQGTDNSKAILLSAHYDSVPTSFGASDDGAGVVAILETLRALRAGEPLRNDVIFLFTDAEEVGLLGANAFVTEHPWARDVGVTFNFEARGNSGPVIMFETSEQNGWLIKEFAKAAPRPVANSAAYEVYRILPNDTDLRVFKKAGLAGLNFAYIDGFTHYHTQLDTFASVDEKSLQHHGSYALNLTRHFGNLDLNRSPERNEVYFDVLGATLIHYSSAWAVPLAIVTALLFASLVVWGIKKHWISFSGMALGFVAVLLSMIAAPLLVTLVWYLINKLNPVTGWKPPGDTYNTNLYLIAFIVLTVAVTSTIYVLFRRRISVENLTVGGLCWWVILSLLTSFLLPGASYLFTWPLLFSMFGLGGALALKERDGASLKRLALLLACSIPAIVLLAPTIYVMSVGLPFSLVGAMMVLVVLSLALLIPHFDVMTANKWSLPVAATMIGVGLILFGILTTATDTNHPKLDSVFYALNADNGKAVWASFDKSPDEWTAQYLSAHPGSEIMPQFFYGNSQRPFLQSPASVESLAAPSVAVLSDSTNNDVRTLRFNVSSPRRASVFAIYFDSELEVLNATVNGKRIESNSTPASKAREKQWAMMYYGIPAEGIELVLDLRANVPVKMRVVDQSYGLPETQNTPYTPRPSNVILAPLPFNYSTLVSRSFNL